ncbi:MULTISPECIES: hypothetical protein [unclassified Microcoleus]|uniref:hypothetical protein n=1 Tax=unclassified Microcoleus TaxID=2642155 RepID=UPI002FCF7B40
MTDAPYGERCVSFDDFIGVCGLVTDAPYGERCVSFDDFIGACGLVTDAPYSYNKGASVLMILSALVGW